MNASTALTLVITLLSISFCLQAIEVLIFSSKPSFAKIWSYENLRVDWETGIPLPSKWAEYILSNQFVKINAILQIVLSLVGIFTLNPIFYLLLFLIHLIFCIRFRGTFNGGSDMMGFVILTGILISLLGQSVSIQRLGLIYITVHTLYSYLKAGLVKLRQADWRSGKAIPAFLSRSLFDDSVQMGLWLEGRPRLSQFLCLGVIVFELAIVFLPIYPYLTRAYFLLALVFHFLNYIAFGLNRFFWIWLSAWPAVLYCLSLLSLS